jgi:hypothetical protein
MIAGITERLNSLSACNQRSWLLTSLSRQTELSFSIRFNKIAIRLCRGLPFMHHHHNFNKSFTLKIHTRCSNTACSIKLKFGLALAVAISTLCFIRVTTLRRLITVTIMSDIYANNKHSMYQLECCNVYSKTNSYG